MLLTGSPYCTFISFTDRWIYKYKLGKNKKTKMPFRTMTQDTILPSKIVKVSADEMIAIMRRNSARQFVPAVLHNNAAGAPVLSHVMWTFYLLDILFNYFFLSSFTHFHTPSYQSNLLNIASMSLWFSIWKITTLKFPTSFIGFLNQNGS